MNCSYSKTKTDIRKNNKKQEKYPKKDTIVLSTSSEETKNENKNEDTNTFEYGLTFPCNTSPNLFLNNLKFRLENYGCIQGLNSDDLVL